MERMVVIRPKAGKTITMRAEVTETDGVLIINEVRELFEEVPEADQLDKTFQIAKSGQLVIRIRGEKMIGL